MAELACQRTNSAKLRDDALMVHVRNVHNEGTAVNVECVGLLADTFLMAGELTTGAKLRGLMDRAGMGVRGLARAAGYAHGSGVQRYIDDDFDGTLSNAVAKRLADALEGKGDPPIVRAEIFALTGLEGVFEAEPNTVLPPRYLDLPRDVPAYGTALGTFSENEMIEQTIVNHDDPIDFFVRPPGLANRKGVYGLYVAGESQSPRFKPGELLFVDPNRTPMIGDDVVVYIKRPEGEGEAIAAILVKELARRTHNAIELRQLNPLVEFSIETRKVAALHKVLTNSDLYGGYR